MTDEDILTVENAFCGYGKKIVVKDFSFSISKGQIISLIGPNGEGKSTVLKSISKQITLLGGSVAFASVPLEKWNEKDFSKKLSVLLTTIPHNDFMTCRQVVESGRYPYTGRIGTLQDEDKKIVEQTLRLLQLEDMAEKKFFLLSDGQKQRVMIARAICQKPDILVLDEPFNFLDINYKMHLIEVLRSLAMQGMSVLMSVHEVDLALKASDKILAVKNNSCKEYSSLEFYNDNALKSLYSLDEFSNFTFSCELKSLKAPPEVFVISDSGRGIPFYRELTRRNIPFAAGILYENDVDYFFAKMSASKVFSQKPFENLTEEIFEQSKNCIDSCAKVIDAGFTLGRTNLLVKKLREYSEEKLWHIQ